ncbi:MAG: uroporphyrinogen-III synthase [Proteobacteria bacterium]|jgi:uroporphyrinogen-III synthase|nr:uroporphyrinogen-III synthase [Alphaproteobacteria bacterium]NCC03229.1 uroporphyrinogen-III synthase [Pseudomonadota bacterium]
MTTVLVTRLRPFAGPLMGTLETMGYEVWHEPLLTVEPLYQRRPESVFSITPIVAITSRVTLEMLQTRRDEVTDLLNEPCYCVGDQTAQDASAFGFTDVVSASGNGRMLAQCIMEQESARETVLHIGVENRNPEMADILTNEGWNVVHWPIYRAREVSNLSEHVLEALGQGKIDVVTLHSARAAQTFVKIIEKNGLISCCSALSAVVFSGSVAKALQALPFKEVIVPPMPTEGMLVEVIRTRFPVG